MPDTITDLVRRSYDAHARGDHAAVFAILHPEVEILQTDLLPWGGRYWGHAEAREFFQRLAEHVDSHVTPEEFVEAGEQVAVTGRIRGHARASGSPFDLRIVHVWTVRLGRVIRFEAYIDTPGMLRALEGKPDPEFQMT